MFPLEDQLLLGLRGRPSDAGTGELQEGGAQNPMNPVLFPRGIQLSSSPAGRPFTAPTLWGQSSRPLPFPESLAGPPQLSASPIPTGEPQPLVRDCPQSYNTGLSGGFPQMHLTPQNKLQPLTDLGGLISHRTVASVPKKYLEES